MRNGENEKNVDRSGFFGIDGTRLRFETGGVSVDLFCYLDSSASFTADRVMPIRIKKANMTLG